MQPPVAGIQERRVTTWLNTPFEIGFRLIDRLTVRFDVSEDSCDRSVSLLGLWPGCLLPIVPTWWRLAEHVIWQPSTYWGFGHSHHRAALLPLSGCRAAGSMSWDRRGFTWEDAAAEHAALVTGWWCGSCAASGPKE
jgi:hypothetical protein